MVHSFEMLGKYIAYDSESCAIHQLDNMAYDVLNEYISLGGLRPAADILTKLGQDRKYNQAEINAICDEYDQLIISGDLFAPEVVADYHLLYPDEPRIKAMCLHICHDCNMRCRYCFAGTGDYGTGHRSMLSVETGKRAVDFLIAASGNRYHLDIDFFGGEPLMNWPVVKEMTYYCQEAGKRAGKDIRLTITTNALLLDEEKTRFINEHMKNCVLSIDGRPEVHNYMRPGIGGKPTYKPVSDRIRTFLLARTAEDCPNKEHYVRATFTKHNLDFSKDVEHIARELNARHVSVEPVVAPDGCGYEISLDDLPAIEKEYENLAEYLDHSRKIHDPVQFFHFIMDMKGGPCVYKRLKGCGVGAEYCAVTPEGDIYPCHQFVGEEEFLMGNVMKMDEITDSSGKMLPNKSVDDILDSTKRQMFFDRLMPNAKTCQTCFARYHCGGGCMANRYHATGSLDEEYEIGCRLSKKRLECTLWLAVSGAETEV